MTNFVETLALIRDGQLVIQATDELQDVITAVVEHGKKGSLTLKLMIEPNGDNAVTITSEVKATVPKPGVGKAIFFADQGGNLSRRDPRQRDIDDIPGVKSKEH